MSCKFCHVRVTLKRPSQTGDVVAPSAGGCADPHVVTGFAGGGSVGTIVECGGAVWRFCPRTSPDPRLWCRTGARTVRGAGLMRATSSARAWKGESRRGLGPLAAMPDSRRASMCRKVSKTSLRPRMHKTHETKYIVKAQPSHRITGIRGGGHPDPRRARDGRVVARGSRG